MIPVIIETLVVGPSNSASVIVLRAFGESKTDGRVLPIWIGPNEAASIGFALEGFKAPRPMTHDLIGSILRELDAKIDHVTITKVEGSTFYATLYFTRQGRMMHVDARPSDSIALAVRAKAPVFVDDSVMDRASFPYIMGKASRNEQAEIEAFHEFVKTLEPDDFDHNENQGPAGGPTPDSDT